MNAILTGAAARPPRRSILRRLSTLALATLERIALPQRDLPPGFYRFPPF